MFENAIKFLKNQTCCSFLISSIEVKIYVWPNNQWTIASILILLLINFCQQTLLIKIKSNIEIMVNFIHHGRKSSTEKDQRILVRLEGSNNKSCSKISIFLISLFTDLRKKTKNKAQHWIFKIIIEKIINAYTYRFMLV